MQRLRSILTPLASLRLTVVLFVLAMILIFAGTLAQREAGNWEVVNSYFRSFVVLIPLRHLFFVNVSGVLPFPGGFILGGLLLVNLLAAHAARFQWNRKRAGIWLIHSGLVLLLVGELVTALLAREAIMIIDEGGYANYTEDIRRVELAVVDETGAEHNLHVVIPEPTLKKAAGREPIAHDLLPFQVRVDRWMDNSQIIGLGMAGPELRQNNRATAGFGTQAIAQPLPPTTGVDQQTVDARSAYVTLIDDQGQPLGTYLLSTLLAQRQEVTAGGKTYGIELRFKREYQPYTIHLIDFRHDKFVGTETPRNFSSLIRLVDPQQHEDRQVLIYMNHPLRYRGQTFYQQSFKPDDSGTVLQVVRNPGWLLPYISCVMVAAGLVLHFGLMLVRFVGRQRTAPSGAKGRAGPPEPALQGETPRVGWLPSVAAGAVALLIVGGQVLPRSANGPFNLDELARVPVTAQGRVKPLDTVARSSLMIVSGRQTLRHEGRTLPAVQWLLDVISRPEVADQYEVFRIDHPDVRSLIGAGPQDEGRKRFSYARIKPHLSTIADQADMANRVKANQRNGYQRHVLELASHLTLYIELQQGAQPYAVPPLEPGEEWRPLGQALHEGHTTGKMNPAAAELSRVFQAYRDQDAGQFNSGLSAYTDLLAPHLPGAMRKAGFEVFFNRLQPFYQGTVLYVLTFLTVCGALLAGAWEGRAWAQRLGVAAVTLLAAGFLLHSFGIAARIYLQGRPPVTNLYSSAVFIGWVCVILGGFLERFYRNGLGVALAAVIGAATLIIAHNLADGDTMQMMQAVLDSNFWLSTHVITVTIGYAAAFLAGGIALVFLFMGVYTRQLTPTRFKAMGKMMYGVIAFALLFSFVGTVLGGIWADQSWGRFWGWDPKENGAVLIVLMNALILHARWGGMIQQRGVAVLAVAGNIVTAWSWFGTNMLGVGLHSYGFMNSAMFWLLAFVVSQLAAISVGLIPMHRWASFERRVPPRLAAKEPSVQA